MHKKGKLAVIGGDFRQVALARYLLEKGYEVAAFGMSVSVTELKEVVLAPSISEAVTDSIAVVLPLPVSSDGMNVNCPLNDDQKLSFGELLNALPTGGRLIGGKFSAPLQSMAEEKGLQVFDYFCAEDFQIKNAVPTAEGALAIAMGELSVTLNGARVAVTGYGRIAKILAKLLLALGAHVTVAARKSEDLAWASLSGCDTVKLGTGKRAIHSLSRGHDVIFNTVPHKLFDEAFLAVTDPKTLIIDLASAPGGVDVAAAGRYGIRVIWALSLPGKYSPITAGRIIGESTIGFLDEKKEE